MCKVSLIIPCYRGANTLNRAIKSVLAQTRPVDEIIVVNDCSPEADEIERVLLQYPNVVYAKNAVNLGLAATRNKGVSVASGDIVCFLDVDDELHPQKIELQLNIFRENAAISCGVRIIRDGNAVEAGEVYKDSGNVRVIKTHTRMLFRNTITGASLMISKKLMVKVDGYDERLRSCEDYDLWLRLLEAGITVYDIQYPLYLYYYNEDGLSKDLLNISYWELEVMRKFFDIQENMTLHSKKAACVWTFYMIKHLVRCEMSGDKTLKARTFQNILLLSGHKLLTGIIHVAITCRIIKLLSILIKQR